MKSPAQLHPFSIRRSHANRGSAYLVALGTIAILSLVAANVVRVTTQRQRACFQESSWGESLAAAEAGADIAIATLRSSTWTGWTGPDANGVRTYQTPVLTHDGEGGTSFYAVVKVDSPAAFNTSQGRFYRIRSTGTALLSGGSGAVSQDKLNNSLWKLSLKRNRDTGATVTGAGLVSRTIEVIAKPNHLFPRPLTLTNSLKANNAGSYIDSFDSSDPAKSTNGLYDPAKRQTNAKIASLDSTGSNLNGLTVHGDLMYSGPVLPGTGGVTGEVTTPFYETLPPVPKPNWATLNGSYGAVSSTMTLVSGPPGAPTRYKMSSLSYISTKTLTLAPPAAGQPGEIEIWVAGNFSISAGAKIVAPPGVKVTFIIEGNISSSGSGLVNQSSKPGNFVVKGVTPADGSARTYSMLGTADFNAAIYAPAYDISIGGGGSYSGAFVGKTMLIKTGSAEIHYDEALGRDGGGTQYEVASWLEDVR